MKPGALVELGSDGVNAQQSVVNRHFQTESAAWRDVYEEESVQGDIYRKRLNIVLSWIDGLGESAGAKVLEVGCGGGRAAIALAQRGYHVDAIDSASNMLAITRACASQAGVLEIVSTKVGNVYQLEFADNSFPLILAMGVMPYLGAPKKALAEMARVLSPGGSLVVTAGNQWRLHHILDPWLCPPLQPARRMAARAFRTFRPPRRERFHPTLQLERSKAFERALFAAGFAIVKKTTVGFQPLTFRQRPILSEQTSIKLNQLLQSLADRGVPGIRSMGMDHIFLARKM
jgi:ubiquinone/menaquinone biosynthesis C-methylase UbiE